MRTHAEVVGAQSAPAPPRVVQARPGRGRHRDTDRRLRVPPPGLGRSYPIAAGALAVVAAGFAGLALLHARLAGPRPATLSELLAAAASALAAAFFVICTVRSRLSGEATALLLGSAVLVFGVFCVAVPELALPLAGHASSPYIRSAQLAGLLTTLALLALAAVGREWGPALRPAWVVTAALAVAGAACATAGLHPVRAVLPRIPAPEQSAAAHGAPLAASLILATTWMLFAAGYSLRGIGRRRPLLAWSGLMLLGLAVADLGLASADRPAHVWIVGSGSVRLVALLLAVFGGALELERAFVEQRARLLDVEISARTNETRWRLHQAHEQDRDHDLRSALVAIEGAALTLERHYDTLTDQERDRLTSMLSSGVDRLQRLLVQEGRPRASFALADVVRPFVGNLVAEGETVDVAVPDDMVAYGSPAETAEVVRQLLDTARRRVPGGTITVRGEQEGQAVVLRVDDQGQLAGGDRRRGAIRSPETVPAETPEELPVALHVASRLMREQGGDLWVEAQSSGRSSFALSLPAPTLGPASLS